MIIDEIVASPAKIKLSKRLDTIVQAIPAGVDHIWDCCCDHGFLGMALLERGVAKHIHFVDIVDSIIDKLNHNLLSITPASHCQYTTYCSDVAALPLDGFAKQDKHLIIIAGVGGELTLAIVERLLKTFPDLSLSFILCPIRHQFNLRSRLAKTSLKLVDEQLVQEGKMYYEIMHFSCAGKHEIVDVGSRLWLAANAAHLHYLRQIIAHYQRVDLAPDHDAKSELYRYQQLHDRLEASAAGNQ